MPAQKVIGNDAIDEQRKFIAMLSLSPTPLPVLDHGLDASIIFPDIAAVRLGDGRAEKGSDGELLCLVDSARDLHLDLAGRFNRDFLKIGSDGFAEGSSLFEIR